MTRRAAQLRVPVAYEGPLEGWISVDPNGGHELRLRIGHAPVEHRYNRQQVMELRALCEAFEAAAEEADEGPDLLHPKLMPLRGR